MSDMELPYLSKLITTVSICTVIGKFASDDINPCWSKHEMDNFHGPNSVTWLIFRQLRSQSACEF